jgi:hypothetical protein
MTFDRMNGAVADDSYHHLHSQEKRCLPKRQRGCYQKMKIFFFFGRENKDQGSKLIK